MSPDRRAQDAVSLLARRAAGETSAGEAVDDAIALFFDRPSDEVHEAVAARVARFAEQARAHALESKT